MKSSFSGLMQFVFVAFLSLVFGLSACVADIMFRSTLPGRLTITYAAPSGESKEVTVYAGNPLGAGYIAVPDATAGVQCTVKDESGAQVWAGELKNGFWSLMALTSDGKPEVRTTGYVTNRTGTQPQQVIVVNLTGETVKVDFFGQSGNAGFPNAEFPPSDQKALSLKMPAGESYFNATIKGADGTALNKSRYGVSPAYWYVLTKTKDEGYGAYQLTQLGWISQ